MFERLRKLYAEEKLTQEQLHWWVDKGITEEEYQAIIAE